MSNNIFDILVKYCANERNDAMTLKSAGYQKLQNEGQKVNQDFKQLDITEEQRDIIDNMMAEQNAILTYFSEINYRQGFLDCISLLKEINVL